MENRAGFERAFGKAKRDSSMAINKTDENSEINDAHFLYNLLNLVNSIKATTSAKKTPSPIKISMPSSLGETAKNIPQVTPTMQANISARTRRLWLWAVKRWNSSSKISESNEGFHHWEEARSKNKGIQPFLGRVSTCEKDRSFFTAAYEGFNSTLIDSGSVLIEYPDLSSPAISGYKRRQLAFRGFPVLITSSKSPR